MTIEALEKRVEQVEDLIADIPVMLNARLETIAAGYAETGARLVVIDKQLAALTRDVRDMRGSVTRQLLAQDERLRTMETRLGTMEGRLSAHDEKLSTMSGQLATIFDRLSAQDNNFTTMSDQLATILDRLPPRT